MLNIENIKHLVKRYGAISVMLQYGTAYKIPHINDIATLLYLASFVRRIGPVGSLRRFLALASFVMSVEGRMNNGSTLNGLVVLYNHCANQMPDGSDIQAILRSTASVLSTYAESTKQETSKVARSIPYSDDEWKRILWAKENDPQCPSPKP